MRWLLPLALTGFVATVGTAGYFAWPYVDDFLSPAETCSEQRTTLIARAAEANKAATAIRQANRRNFAAEQSDWDKASKELCAAIAVGSAAARSFDRVMDRYYRQCNPNNQQRDRLMMDATMWQESQIVMNIDEIYIMEGLCSRWPW